jgi:DNA-binding transcriptional LysR family regulator
MQLPKQFYYKKNCLQQLKGFCNTVQTGNISKAAQKMGLSQSTITLQIQSLERDLKTKLFDRDKKRIKLNNDGKIFYEMISYHINGIDSSYQEFLRRKSNQSPTIKIAAHHVAISHLLPPYIKKFQKQHPKVKISIKNIAPGEAIKRLQEDEIDLILYPNVNATDEFLSHTCFSYDPVLIMHKEHPLAKKSEIKLTDISKHNVIRIDRNLITLPLFEEAYKEFGFKTNIDFENGNWEMVKSFVREGIGLGFVSELYVTKDDSDLVCKKLSNYFPTLEYKLVMKNGKHLTKETQDFINILSKMWFIKSDFLDI